MKLILILLLAAIVSLSQSAKVVSLSEADASAAKQAKANLDEAQRKWDELRTDIQQRYVSDAVSVSGTGLISNSLGSSSTIVWSGGAIRSSIDPCDIRSVSLDSFDKAVAACKEWFTDRDKAERERKEALAKLPKETVYTLKQDWQGGFEFSDDFRFIVPAPPKRENVQQRYSYGGPFVVQ